jgi:hypothetical protein
LINLISLLSPTPEQAAPAVSTDSSALLALDFSALLTELVGPMNEGPLPEGGLLPEGTTPSAPIPVASQLLLDVAATTPKAGVENEAEVPIEILAPELLEQAVAASMIAQHLLDDATTPEPVRDLPTAPEPRVLPAPALLEDLKKIEIEIRHEAVKPAEIQLPEEAELPKPAIVTTDPIANIRQAQLPPRVIAIQRVSVDSKSRERKSESAAMPPSETRTAIASTPFANAGDPIEPVRPAQPVEIPDLPKLQVVRTVAMEVGDADSQVMVRIDDRTSGMALHFGAADEALHRTIESSVFSLVRALKQERIQISNVEVSRKSPIDKVHRMKEAKS